MAELKPCPFCGGEAFVYARYDSIWRGDPTDYTVICKNCHAGVRNYFLTAQEAIEAWNKRTERPKGRWDETDWVKYDGHGECIHYPKAALRCSNCCNAFKKNLLWKRNFCPNCGAEMRGESE